MSLAHFWCPLQLVKRQMRFFLGHPMDTLYISICSIYLLKAWLGEESQTRRMLLHDQTCASQKLQVEDAPHILETEMSSVFRAVTCHAPFDSWLLYWTQMLSGNPTQSFHSPRQHRHHISAVLLAWLSEHSSELSSVCSHSFCQFEKHWPLSRSSTCIHLHFLLKYTTQISLSNIGFIRSDAYNTQPHAEESSFAHSQSPGGEALLIRGCWWPPPTSWSVTSQPHGGRCLPRSRWSLSSQSWKQPPICQWWRWQNWHFLFQQPEIID